jgi:UDP-glucose 4-epimerase
MAGHPSGAPVVVTGGAGAIGTFVVRSLVQDGHPVRVVDNLSSGRREFLEPLLSEGKATLHVADVRVAETIEPEFRGASAVWHLAANPDIRLGTSDPRVDLENGTIATFRVLEAARRTDVPTVLFSSSSVVYGLPSVFPTPEEYGPLLPQSLYGASKLAAEGLLSAYAHSYGLKAYIFRFANIIGPIMTHGILYDFAQKLRRDPTTLEVLGDGRQSKSYLRVEECVEAMRFVSQHAGDLVNVYNLGTRDRISVAEIAQKVVAAHGDRARIVYTGGTRGWIGDVPTLLLSTAKVEALGWHPRHSSGEAVDITIREMTRVP